MAGEVEARPLACLPEARTGRNHQCMVTRSTHMANASFDDPRREPDRTQGERSAGRPVVSGPELVQAQFSSGTFSTVTAGTS